MNQRGSALVAVLGLAMILLPLGAFVVMQCRTDLLIQRNLRAEIEAFYVAEAGLEHAVADIAPDTSFDDLLAGPDHAAGTADDGVFPFRDGAPADFPESPFRYEVRVTRSTRDALSIVSAGSGRQGAAQVVSATVVRSHVPFTPAAVYSVPDIGRIDWGEEGFILSGRDHRATDRPGHPTGTAASIAGLSGSDADAAASLRARLSPTQAARLVGAGSTPSIDALPGFDVQRYAAACAELPGASRLSPAAVGASPLLGTLESPQVSVLTGDFDAQGAGSGAGVLVVRGMFHVSGTFTFVGLVVTMGGVILEPGSEVTILGAFWRAPSSDERCELRGRGALAYSSEALGAVDRAIPGFLPHAAVVTGWQEIL